MNQLSKINANKDLTSQFSSDQLQLIINTVARGASPDELQLFLYRCNLLKLNPLKPGQIHFVKYGNSPGTIVIGIDGFRATGIRTGLHVSTNRGVNKNENGEIVSGWCRIKKRDQTGEIQEFYEETPFVEYFNEKNPSWKKMPETMIKKCSEAACHRMAYPDDLGGVYVDAERDAIEASAGHSEGGSYGNGNKVIADQPNADDGDASIIRPYTIPFGKFKMRSLEEVGPDQLRGYVEYLEKKAEKEGKEIQGIVGDFIKRASEYVVSFENQAINENDAPY